MDTTVAAEKQVESNATPSEEVIVKAVESAAPVTVPIALTFAHQELLKSKNIQSGNLPADIKMSINAWNMGLRKYNNQKTEKLLEMQKKGSVRIADSIQNWIEKDLPEKSEAEVKAENEVKLAAENEIKLAAENEIKARAERERVQREDNERRARERRIRDARPPQETKEQKVAKILTERGKITYKELVEIIGQEFSGETLQIGDIKLFNVFMTNNYKQTK